MNTAIFISVGVLVVIAAIEVVCLFGCSKLRIKNPSVTIAVPILPDDGELSEKLSYMSMLLSDDSIGIGKIILLDCGASPEQLDLCRRFCGKYPETVLTEPEMLKDTYH